MAFGDIVQGPQGQASLIQAVSSDTVIEVTFTNSPAVGNLIVAVHFTGATDSQAYTGMTEAVPVTDGTNSDQGAIYFRVVQAADGKTWGANSGGADEHGIIVWEIEGPFAASPLDQTAVNAGNPVTAPGSGLMSTGTTGTTSQNDEVAIAIVTDRGGDSVSSWSNTFVNSERGPMDAKTVFGAFKVLTATGTVETTATMSSGADVYMAGIATFKKAAASATLEQEGFRWFNDDGSESASTAAAAQDTSITAAAGQTRRIRMLLDATGDPATTQYKLQYKLSTDGSWTDVA